MVFLLDEWSILLKQFLLLKEFIMTYKWGIVMEYMDVCVCVYTRVYI